MKYVDNPFKSPTVLSFCPGLRGLERGLEAIIGKVNVITFVEIEAFIIANLVAEMESGLLDPAPIWTDVRTFDARPFRDRVHWCLAGYPCTPFSLAGLRQGEDDPRHLWPHLFAIFKTVRPICIFLENVDDHLTLGFDQVYADLSSLGYAVETGIYSANEAGAPHERQRMFVLAVENSYVERNRGRNHLREIWGREIQASRPSELGNTSSVNAGARTREIGQIEFGRSSSELANTNVFTWRLSDPTRWNESIKTSRRSRKLANTNDGHRQRKIKRVSTGREGTNNESARTSQQYSKELADSNFCRQQQWQYARVGRFEELNALSNTGVEGLQRGVSQESSGLGGFTGFYQWPAGPGERQYGWEPPRTLTREAESLLGLSVDGFSFREDFLRALGNACVPEQAAIALVDLLRKHFQ